MSRSDVAGIDAIVVAAAADVKKFLRLSMIVSLRLVTCNAELHPLWSPRRASTRLPLWDPYEFSMIHEAPYNIFVDFSPAWLEPGVERRPSTNPSQPFFLNFIGFGKQVIRPC